jgi:hypothetical protein
VLARDQQTRTRDEAADGRQQDPHGPGQGMRERDEAFRRIAQQTLQDLNAFAKDGSREGARHADDDRPDEHRMRVRQTEEALRASPQLEQE